MLNKDLTRNRVNKELPVKPQQGFFGSSKSTLFTTFLQHLGEIRISGAGSRSGSILGSLQGVFREPFGEPLGSIGEPLGSIWGPLVAFGVPWGPFGAPGGSFAWF